MNLNDLLQALPLENLISFENHTQACQLVHSGKEHSHRSLSLDEKRDAVIQEICSFYESEDRCAALLNLLTAPEKQLLVYFLRSALWEAIPFRQMEDNLTHEMTGMELKAALIGLREKGIVFAFRKLWGEILYVLPRDISILWHSLIFRSEHSTRGTGTIEASDVVDIQEATPGLHLDIYSLLRFIERYGFPLTQKGTVHKRQVQKSTDHLYLQSAHLQKMTLRYMDQDTYPRSFAVVYDLALRLGLIEKTQEAVVCVDPNVEKWLDQTPATAAKQLFEEWCAVHTPSRVWLQHVLVWMYRSAPQEWISGQYVLKQLKENGIEVMDDHPLRWMEEELFQPLCGLGWLDLGQFEGQRFFRWKPFNEIEHTTVDDNSIHERDQLYVQPNFELMIPPTARLSVRWKAEQFAELKQSDPMSIYSITKESLHHALEKRQTIADIVQFLQSYSRYELPANVQETIIQWADQYGRVRFIDAVFMRCADAALAQELERHPKLNPWIIEKVSATDFLMQRDHVKECMYFLDKHGYAPKKEVETYGDSKKSGTHASHGPSKPHKQRGIILSKNMLSNYQPDPVIPKLEDVVPSIKKLPSSWIQDYRHYHVSTLRDLIVQAIELNTKIRWGNGIDEYDFIPKHLKNNGGTWFMEGRDSVAKEKNIALDDIQNIQIIIP